MFLIGSADEFIFQSLEMYDTALDLGGSNEEWEALQDKVTIGTIRNKI